VGGQDGGDPRFGGGGQGGAKFGDGGQGTLVLGGALEGRLIVANVAVYWVFFDDVTIAGAGRLVVEGLVDALGGIV
jgi:hypothetical protein